jgi:hypothetical protein
MIEKKIVNVQKIEDNQKIKLVEYQLLFNKRFPK